MSFNGTQCVSLQKTVSLIHFKLLLPAAGNVYKRHSRSWWPAVRFTDRLDRWMSNEGRRSTVMAFVLDLTTSELLPHGRRSLPCVPGSGVIGLPWQQPCGTRTWLEVGRVSGQASGVSRCAQRRRRLALLTAKMRYANTGAHPPLTVLQRDLSCSD